MAAPVTFLSTNVIMSSTTDDGRAFAAALGEAVLRSMRLSTTGQPAQGGRLIEP
jgi:hypothetical protein